MSLRTVAERRAEGQAARKNVPRSSHAHWSPAPGRPSPVALLRDQNQQRIPWLVPVRHARMRVSPFTFFRGTAGIMAADLVHTPNSGLQVQLGGDMHLSNFGAYASPERRLVFDANDFDETLRGPWEWDLKRLTTSFMVAARHRAFDPEACRRITATVVEAYRRAMEAFGRMGFLELWYDHVSVEDVHLLAGVDQEELARRVDEFSRKARSKTSLHALRKLTEDVDGRFRIKSDAPLLVPIREVHPDFEPAELQHAVRAAFDDYLSTLRDDRRQLLERYELLDVALKVVGVGSVGTRCYVLLLEGRDSGDPLFLQAKEATASVLEEHLGPSPYEHHGERVVEGQRQIQAQSDICLGWATGVRGVHFYFRQLRDWKRSVDVESSTPRLLEFYARLCGHTLARGHARSGDPAAIAAYMGRSARLDGALTAFSERYADQTLADFEAFEAAIADGTLPVAADA